MLLLGGISVTKGDIFDIIGGISYIKRDKTLFRRLFLLLLRGILDIVAINLFMDKNHIKKTAKRVILVLPYMFSSSEYYSITRSGSTK